MLSLKNLYGKNTPFNAVKDTRERGCGGCNFTTHYRVAENGIKSRQKNEILMAIVNLDVKVFGGEQPPIPITIYVDGDDFHLKFKEDSSFNKDLTLTPGNYHLNVAGLNPDGGSTKVSLTGPFTDGPNPSNAQSANSKSYALIFFFTV
jgi:hypothetical protein